MKSMFLAAALILTSLSAQAASSSSRCTVSMKLKDAEAFFNVRVNKPGSTFVGPCLSEEVQKALAVDFKSGKTSVPDETYIEKVAKSVIASVQQEEEAAKWKQEVFESQMNDVEFPAFLDEEADLKRGSPLEGTEE